MGGAGVLYAFWGNRPGERLAEHDVENPEDIRAFSGLDCRFEPDLSKVDHFMFVKGEK